MIEDSGVESRNPDGAMPELDAEGFLVDPNDWTEAVAIELARREGITLGDDHWDAIREARLGRVRGLARARHLRSNKPGSAARPRMHGVRICQIDIQPTSEEML